MPPFFSAKEETGLVFHHIRGTSQEYYFPEIMGSGVCILDYDNDGFVDVYFVQSGDLRPGIQDKPGNVLYRNRGDGTFENTTETAQVGDTGYGMGCACADFDGDGDTDLYVTNVGANVMYQNNGDGTFTDVTTHAGVGDPAWSCSTAFVDIDQDNDLDLFVTNYLTWSIQAEMECFSSTGARDYCKPNNYNSPAADTLYLNNGNGTFTDISEESGIRASFGNGLGVTIGDFNNDLKFDIYVANDGMANQLWVNQGNNRFVNDAVIAGCAVNGQGAAEAGMGVAAIDVNYDGHLDLFMTHLRDETNTLYINNGKFFDDKSSAYKLTSASVDYTGFGLAFADFQNLGALGLYIANGRVGLWEPTPNSERPYAEADLFMYAHFSVDSFSQATEVTINEEHLAAGRGVALADLNNDGRLEVLVGNNGAPAHILKVNPSMMNFGHPIMFVLDRGNLPVEGSLVTVKTKTKQYTRYVHPAASYCSSHDLRVHFGVSHDELVDEITVRWPDGTVDTFGETKSDACYRLVQGSSAPVLLYELTVAN